MVENQEKSFCILVNFQQRTKLEFVKKSHVMRNWSPYMDLTNISWASFWVELSSDTISLHVLESDTFNLLFTDVGSPL